MPMESSRGKEGSSWENVDFFGNEQFFNGIWEYFTLKKGRGKEDSGRCGAGKATRNTRSVASKSEEMWICHVAPKSRGKAASQQGMTAGKSSGNSEEEY